MKMKFSLKKPNWSSEIWIGVSAMIVSCCALFISFDQAYQSRVYNRLSVRPLLVAKSASVVNEDEGFFIENKGLGPAIITKFTVFLDGKQIKGTPTSLWENMYKATRTHPFKHQKQITGQNYAVILGTALSPGESRYIYEIKRENTNQESSELIYWLVKHVDIYIEYKSLYGEYFTLKAA